MLFQTQTHLRFFSNIASDVSSGSLPFSIVSISIVLSLSVLSCCEYKIGHVILFYAIHLAVLFVFLMLRDAM